MMTNPSVSLSEDFLAPSFLNPKNFNILWVCWKSVTPQHTWYAGMKQISKSIECNKCNFLFLYAFKINVIYRYIKSQHEVNENCAAALFFLDSSRNKQVSKRCYTTFLLKYSEQSKEQYFWDLSEILSYLKSYEYNISVLLW